MKQYSENSQKVVDRAFNFINVIKRSSQGIGTVNVGGDNDGNVSTEYIQGTGDKFKGSCYFTAHEKVPYGLRQELEH